jgi:hypothetical protein
MVSMLFAKPEDTPTNAPWMSMEEIMLTISKSFPKVSVTDSGKIRMGKTLKELGYERKRANGGQRYHINLLHKNDE